MQQPLFLWKTENLGLFVCFLKINLISISHSLVIQKKKGKFNSLKLKMQSFPPQSITYSSVDHPNNVKVTLLD